jgi:hypothetical protein
LVACDEQKTIHPNTADLLKLIPDTAWTEAYDSDGRARDGAWVAELTGLLDLSGWPKDLRVIVRKERPHPGAQLRITDVDGNRVTAFATNTPVGGPGTQVPELELRHRRRARAEDRIRCAKDTGLTNLPLHGFDANRIWCAIVALACDITAWMQTLALTEHPARRWEPKRLRLRLFSITGAIATTARTTMLHVAQDAPWTDLAVNALTRLRSLALGPTAASGSHLSPTQPCEPHTCPAVEAAPPERHRPRCRTRPPQSPALGDQNPRITIGPTPMQDRG